MQRTSVASLGRLPRWVLLGADPGCCAGLGGVHIVQTGLTWYLLRRLLPLTPAGGRECIKSTRCARKSGEEAPHQATHEKHALPCCARPCPAEPDMLRRCAVGMTVMCTYKRISLRQTLLRWCSVG